MTECRHLHHHRVAQQPALADVISMSASNSAECREQLTWSRERSNAVQLPLASSELRDEKATGPRGVSSYRSRPMRRGPGGRDKILAWAV